MIAQAKLCSRSNRLALLQSIRNQNGADHSDQYTDHVRTCKSMKKNVQSSVWWNDK